MDKVKSTKSAEYLLEFAQLLEKEVLDLRAVACEKAAKARSIRKLIPEEQLQEVEEQKEADEAWSMGNGLIDIIKDKKVVIK